MKSNSMGQNHSGCCVEHFTDRHWMQRAMDQRGAGRLAGADADGVEYRGAGVDAETGKQLSPAEALAIQNISAEASKDLTLMQSLYSQYKANPERGHAAEDRSLIQEHESKPACAVAGSSHQRPGALRTDYCSSESDPDYREQLCFADSAGAVFMPDNRDGKAEHCHPSSQGLEKAMEPAGMRSQRECCARCRALGASVEVTKHQFLCSQFQFSDEVCAMSLPVIAITNASTCLTDEQVEAAIPALQRQVSLDFKATGIWIAIDLPAQRSAADRRVVADF